MNQLLSDSPQIAANDMVMAKEMADALHTAYPGHLWAVTCDGKSGMADVRNLFLSGQWGFRLKLHAIYSGSEFKREVIRAGGELLERFKLSRRGFRPDEYSALPVDFAGRLIHHKD